MTQTNRSSRAPGSEMSLSKHERNTNTAIYIVLSVISAIWLLPFIFLVLQSFRSYLTENGGMVSYLIPKKFSLDNYQFLFSSECNFFTWYLNTLEIAAAPCSRR